MAVWSSVVRFGAVDKFSAVLSKMEERNRKFAASASNSFKKVEADAARVSGKINGLWNQVKGLAAVVSVASLMTIGANAIVDYEAATASLSAVTGVTGDALEKMNSQVLDIAKTSKKSAIDVAKSFEIVGSAMSQYLEDPKALGQITEAGILLSKASKMQLEPALQSLTGAMNQFNLGAESAMKTVNILTAGEIVGQVSTEKSVDALSKFGAVANSMNTTLPESVALIQVLGKKLPTEEIGRSARNLLLFMDTSKGASKEALEAFSRNGVSLDVLSDKTLSTADRLKELSKVQNDSVAMSQIFGKENITAGKVIFDQLDTYKAWVAQIAATEKAQEQAAKNSATISNKLKEVRAAFENAIISSTNGSIGMKMFSGVLTLVANNLDWIIGLIAGLAAVIIPMIGIYKLITFLTTAFNVGLALQALLMGKGAIALKGNVIALKAYRSITYLATAAQWAWNAALTANPIGLIIVAIAAAIAAIIALVYYWDKIKAKFEAAPTWVKAAMMPFIVALGPLLILVNGIRKVVDAWDGIKKAFSEGGFIDGIKKLGGVLISALIDPLVFFLKMLAKIPGVGSYIDPLINQYEAFQARAESGFGVDQQLAAREPINIQATQNQAQQKIIEENRQTVDINLNDPKNMLSVDKGKGPIPIKVNKTAGAF